MKDKYMDKYHLWYDINGLLVKIERSIIDKIKSKCEINAHDYLYNKLSHKASTQVTVVWRYLNTNKYDN